MASLLRDFDEHLFTSQHPSEHLRREDARLEVLNHIRRRRGRVYVKAKTLFGTR